MSSAEETLSQVNNEITDSINATGKIPATPEGIVVAYSSLIIMALLPIFFGSFRSLKHHKDSPGGEGGEKPETMTHKDAAMFPIIASISLFAFYIFFKIFSKEHINLLLTGYFFVLGILALCHLTSPIVRYLVPAAIPNVSYRIKFTKEPEGAAEDLIDYTYSTHDAFCLLLCSIVGVWYLIQKHWIINNLFGLTFAINGIELLHLNNVVTGLILLSGLFVYDIFWVFGTNVMVTVAKSFEAPIKLIFPQDILEHGLDANNFAMLGLGDIVIPGVFIALLLRFDHSLKRNSQFYFYSTFAAYFLGLLTTIFVMHMFKHAQPALLYLVPLCIGTPLLMALIRGDIGALFQYEDHPSTENQDEAEGKKVSQTNKTVTKSKKEK